MSYYEEPYDIILSDTNPYGATGYETSETDPVIYTILPSKRVIRYSECSGCNTVTISVDFSARHGRNIHLRWSKDGYTIRQDTSSQWSGRTSIRINRYDKNIEGRFSVRITDMLTKRYAITEGVIVRG